MGAPIYAHLLKSFLPNFYQYKYQFLPRNNPIITKVMLNNVFVKT